MLDFAACEGKFKRKSIIFAIYKFVNSSHSILRKNIHSSGKIGSRGAALLETLLQGTFKLITLGKYYFFVELSSVECSDRKR